MDKDFSAILLDFSEKIEKANTLLDLDVIKVLAFGRDGVLTGLLAKIKNIPIDQRKAYGFEVNTLKRKIAGLLEEKRVLIQQEVITAEVSKEKINVSLPVYPFKYGKLHPVYQVIEMIEDIFFSLGFDIAEGSEIEDVYYNFTAANIPDHHPARQMHDTFYIKGHKGKVLRTHTTPIQIHEMLKKGAPLRVIAPGRVFRSDYDATHTPVFHQVEGLVIDKGVNFSNLIACLKTFFKRFFGVENMDLRVRPSYFPFTEPSAEVDIRYTMKNGKMSLGYGDLLLEVVGCGMVHPHVLRNGGIDPEVFTGFAFGFGVERLASLLYGIPDLRGYFEIDKNWKETFGLEPF